jgi:hypothetical protein
MVGPFDEGLRGQFTQIQVFVEFIEWFENKRNIDPAIEPFSHSILDQCINKELRERECESHLRSTLYCAGKLRLCSGSAQLVV